MTRRQSVPPPATNQPNVSPSDLFSEEELREFLALLLEEKQKILSKSRSTLESGVIQLDTNEMMDEVDLASATIEQNLTFRLLDRERRLLNEIERAIQKILGASDQEYGYCEGTGDPIPKKRLLLAPWTRHSVKHKEYLERMRRAGRLSHDSDGESELPTGEDEEAS